jgi:hypothetical protein
MPLWRGKSRLVAGLRINAARAASSAAPESAPAKIRVVDLQDWATPYDMRVAELTGRVGGGKGEHGHPGRAGRLDAGFGIFDDETIGGSERRPHRRPRVQPLQRQLINGGVRFADRAIVGRDDGLEVVLDGRSFERTVDLDPPASRRHGEPAAFSRLLHELHDAAKEARPVLRRALREQLRLPLRNALRQLRVAGAVARGEQEGRAGALVHAQVGAVVLVGCDRQAGFRQRLLKTDKVGRLIVRDDSVEVEEDGSDHRCPARALY